MEPMLSKGLKRIFTGAKKLPPNDDGSTFSNGVEEKL